MKTGIIVGYLQDWHSGNLRCYETNRKDDDDLFSDGLMNFDNIRPTDFYSFALAIMMFSMGLTLRTKDFVRVFTAPGAVCLGLGGQLLMLPVV
jgi:hypothetical protein